MKADPILEETWRIKDELACESDMTEDPIVAEVRHVRDKLACQFDYDIHAIFADLRAREHAENRAHPLVQDANAQSQNRETG
jgi:hypothetical protein